jgi:hypothetical protein
MTTVEEIYHHVPTSPRASIDSDDDASADARLIGPSSSPRELEWNTLALYLNILHSVIGPPLFPFGPTKGKTLTFYPTALFRLVAIALLITSIGLFVPGGTYRSIPALIALSIAILRVLFVLFIHSPRTSIWRRANLAIDTSIIIALTVTVAVAFKFKIRGHPYPWQLKNVPACIVGWVAT